MISVITAAAAMLKLDFIVITYVMFARCTKQCNTS